MTKRHTALSREIEDEWLAIRCQLGEPGAMDALIRRWHGPIHAYIERQCGPDDAADILQDAWLRVFRGIGALRDGRTLRAWLFGIARRTWMDRLRLRYAQPIDDDNGIEGIADDAVPHELALDLAAMRDGIARLPPPERDVLALFHLRELSLDEIAHVLQIPVGTVKSRLFRARRRLRRELDAQGAHP